MSRCAMCGVSIPEGQRICSMCYGDPEHGSDGYYEAYLERKRMEERRENDG